MAKTINQIHEAAKAFRAQFRPLIEVMDDIAELDNLENIRRELEAGVEVARAEQDKLAELREIALRELNGIREGTEKVKRQGELQSQQVAQEIATAREIASAEAERLRAEVSADIAERQAKAAKELEEHQRAVEKLEDDAYVLEVRLDMLRKAISSIVVGASE